MSSEQQLDRIRVLLRMLVAIHVIVFVSAGVGAAVGARPALQYYRTVGRTLPPERAAAAMDALLQTLGYVRNITDDLSFIVHQAQLFSQSLTPPHTQQAVSQRRSLHEDLSSGHVAVDALFGAIPNAGVPSGLNERFQEAMSGLADVMAVKIAELDVKAPAEFTHWVMGLDWRDGIAHRFDAALNSIRYAELVTGTVLKALATSQANVTALDKLP
jgi:hypothetical protein